ncbi:lactate utilization protein B [Parapedobacter koreensis]|uniref:L-lactate dehydrogenase complex protein LldF n=1 Tax=Parapedobacter koreensis TaxID=332977 RepID=A0A1H7GBR0_9SPHI|nr:lactate utilization protein B [Parapedobacter koreensis]SEK34262.1 L-lactate dehydrogenase complex protein LldF [Parapedobacter koreensis]
MDHASLASTFNKDEPRVDWHDESLWWVRQKRDLQARSVADWEVLREVASAIKNNVLANLGTYLQAFESHAIKRGIVVHWAADAGEHNAIIHRILEENRITAMVKSKSMLTEECGLNAYLADRGIHVVDSDLGERILQLADERPSHIVMPAIHKKKEEIGELFHEFLGTPKGESDPQRLTEAARLHLREVFLTRKAALTGVNFAIAETGEFVVCTNEGNADMGAHLSDVHIASMGIEKLIPQREHLGVFLRLLARSGTGQPITTYSSHFSGPRQGQQMHIVIVDNGRSTQLGRADFKASLKCIRCGACMNTCPVYRRSGGYSYRTTVAGPIGSILAPNLDMRDYADLPFASTLCGSCTNVCPVKIDIHEQLYKWRQVLAKEGHVAHSKSLLMKGAAAVLSRPSWYQVSGKLLRWFLRHFPKIASKFTKWSDHRELPEAPKQTFAGWYKQNRVERNG